MRTDRCMGCMEPKPLRRWKTQNGDYYEGCVYTQAGEETDPEAAIKLWRSLSPES